jgi:hypothetical protein
VYWIAVLLENQRPSHLVQTCSKCNRLMQDKPFVTLLQLPIAHWYSWLIYAAFDVCWCAAGIAWDHNRQRLFITGKQWPRIFEVVLQPADASSPINQQRQQACYVWTP